MNFSSTRNRATAAALLSLGLLGAGAAQARTDVVFSVGIPAPVYTVPAPVYSAPATVYSAPAPYYGQRVYGQAVYEAPVVVAQPDWRAERRARYWEHRRWEERRAWEQRRAWEAYRYQQQQEHRGGWDPH